MNEAQITIAEIPAILSRHEQQITELLNKIENLSQEPEKPITVYEAARFLNKEVQTLYGLTSRRKIPFHKNGRELSFFKSELVEWLKKSAKKVYA
jgi:excisionase family DNA binding protein